MLLADTPTATVVQHVGTILHDLFGGDYPEEPLAILQIAVRAVCVYGATLLIVRIRQKPHHQPDDNDRCDSGFYLRIAGQPGGNGIGVDQRYVGGGRRIGGIALVIDRDSLPVALVRHAAEGKFKSGGGGR